MTNSNHSTSPDQDEISLINQIGKELSIETTEAIQLVAAVLQALRQTLTLTNANDFMNNLPDFLKLVFASNWKQAEAQVEVQHLDELVNLVMERDKRSGKCLFKSEVQTLSVIILTLKHLYKVIDLDNFNGLSRSLRQELRDVPVESAA
jgi:uncharacterized protein (DUF2267 family)